MTQHAIVIGLPESCRRLERQLALLASRPRTLGWIVPDPERAAPDDPVLGSLDRLEAIVTRRRPDVVLVTLPAGLGRLATTTRTRLRRLGVADRFMPTLDDQLAGVGPRARLDIDPGDVLDRPGRRIDEPAVRRILEDRTVVITGAGGSIGSELARFVATIGGVNLVLVDRAENALFEIDRQIARCHPDLPRTALLHDVVDAEGTRRHLRRIRPQVVFHAAAHKHVPMMEDHPAAAIENNLFGTRSIADAADATGADRFVLISTDKAVQPSEVMGATKRFAERYVQQLDQRSAMQCSIVRFGNVLGSTGSVLDIWLRELAEGGPLTVTDPRMTRYFMTIPEAAQLVVQSAALRDAVNAPETPVYVLDMGEPVRVVELARHFVELHGLDAADVGIVFTGARPGEKLHERLATETQALQPTSHPDIRVLREAAPGAAFIEHMLSSLSPRERGHHAAAVAESVWAVLREQARTAAA